jgi:hypothetical protein
MSDVERITFPAITTIAQEIRVKRIINRAWLSKECADKQRIYRSFAPQHEGATTRDRRSFGSFIVRVADSGTAQPPAIPPATIRPARHRAPKPQHPVQHKRYSRQFCVFQYGDGQNIKAISG